MKNILLKNPNYKINSNFFEGLTLFDMVVPANSRKEFYSEQITDNVTTLEKVGDISSIIESEAWLPYTTAKEKLTLKYMIL